MKTIDQISCPYCGKKTLTSKIIPEYHTTMKKIAIVVPNAKIETCSSCNRTIVEAKELFRWEAIRKINLSAGK